MKLGSLLSARCRHLSIKSNNIGGHTSLSTALVLLCDRCELIRNEPKWAPSSARSLFNASGTTHIDPLLCVGLLCFVLKINYFEFNRIEKSSTCWLWCFRIAGESPAVLYSWTAVMAARLVATWTWPDGKIQKSRRFCTPPRTGLSTFCTGLAEKRSKVGDLLSR